MEYLKHHLSIPEQVELLKKRGLEAEDTLLATRLKNVGYYRLSAYLHPFRIRDQLGKISDEYTPGTTLDKVWLYYRFDRKFRFMMLDAIERIEVALRSRIAYYHTQGRSPFAYASADYFPKWKGYIQGLDRLKIQKDKHGKAITKGKDSVDHFFNTYGDKHDYLPLWIAVGEMDFGTVVHFYTHSEKVIKKAIAGEWNIDTSSLESWLNTLRMLRNDCAHHARIWNKTFQSLPRMNNTPNLPWNYVYSDKANKWVKPTNSLMDNKSMLDSQNTLAAHLFICRYLLKQIAPTSEWHIRMQNFLIEFQQQGIPLSKIGLPEYWENHPMWI